MNNYSEYKALRDRAINGTEEDVNELWMWFEERGNSRGRTGVKKI